MESIFFQAWIVAASLSILALFVETFRLSFMSLKLGTVSEIIKYNERCKKLSHGWMIILGLLFLTHELMSPAMRSSIVLN